MLLGQQPKKSLWSVCLSGLLSIDLSVHPSITKFSKDQIISFFWYYTHDDSWPWYLVTDRARFFLKKLCGPKLSPLALKTVLLTFLVNMLWASLLKLCWDLNIVLLIFKPSQGILFPVWSGFSLCSLLFCQQDLHPWGSCKS